VTIAGGTVTIAGGTDEEPSFLQISYGYNSTGAVWLTGGQLNSGNFTIIGDGGGGQMTVSNGTWSTGSAYVESQGTLTIAGGTSSMQTNLVIASGEGAGTGTVWLTGGQLNVSSPTVIGDGGVGQMTVSNGTWSAGSVVVPGSDYGPSQGTLIIAGGASSVYPNMTIGNSNCSGTGTVVVAGGSLYVTNATHNAVLDVESGKLLLIGGTLAVDQMISTNPCGAFQQIGGTLVVGGVTNPFFRVTGIAREGSNVRVTWQTLGGETNVLQATNGSPGGGYNTNFVDLPPQIVVPGVGITTTNFLDVGGATNRPARYYRVRDLVP
jgi:hypothetical protein